MFRNLLSAPEFEGSRGPNDQSANRLFPDSLLISLVLNAEHIIGGLPKTPRFLLLANLLSSNPYFFNLLSKWPSADFDDALAARHEPGPRFRVIHAIFRAPSALSDS
jgi:hypothetical protein